MSTNIRHTPPPRPDGMLRWRVSHVQFPEWTSIISLSVLPVVIISACGLLSLALYNRLAAVVSRLRSFQREILIEREKQERVASVDRARL